MAQTLCDDDVSKIHNDNQNDTLHLKSDGIVKNMNRTINQQIVEVVSDYQRNWDQRKS